MYNYTQFPNNFNNSNFINNSSTRPVSSSNNYDSRFVGGGFLGPFILGGITGGLAAPLFYGGNYGYGRPNYYSNNYYYPYPYPSPYYYR